MSTWFITGCSTGLGRPLAATVLDRGGSVTVVEPGGFRTDFAGRSLNQSSTVINDYAGTAGKRRKENDTVHGTQKGDPARAAQALITAVESPEPRLSSCSARTPSARTGGPPTSGEPRSKPGRSSAPPPTSRTDPSRLLNRHFM